jgi:DNA-binding NtrC family response regulator
MTATILVVDDEPDLEALVLQKFRRQIREGTVNFVFAHDGFEALQKIDSNPNVDMVVSDINMPRMDGLSLLAKLQEADDKKSTIIVSAYGDMSNIRTAMNRGAFDFLTKRSILAILKQPSTRPSGTSRYCATRAGARPKPNARTRRCRATSRRRSQAALPATPRLTAWRCIAGMWQRSSPMSRASPR